jgi:hypothetical protein
LLGCRRVAESGQVECEHAIAGARKRVEVLGPHRTVGDAGVKKHDGRAASYVIVSEKHWLNMGGRRSSLAKLVHGVPPA